MSHGAGTHFPQTMVCERPGCDAPVVALDPGGVAICRRCAEADGIAPLTAGALTTSPAEAIRDAIRRHRGLGDPSRPVAERLDALATKPTRPTAPINPPRPNTATCKACGAPTPYSDALQGVVRCQACAERVPVPPRVQGQAQFGRTAPPRAKRAPVNSRPTPKPQTASTPAPKPKRAPQIKRCTVPGCTRKTVGKGLCKRHYNALRNFAGGDRGVAPLRGSRAEEALCTPAIRDHLDGLGWPDDLTNRLKQAVAHMTGAKRPPEQLPEQSLTEPPESAAETSESAAETPAPEPPSVEQLDTELGATPGGYVERTGPAQIFRDTAIPRTEAPAEKEQPPPKKPPVEHHLHMEVDRNVIESAAELAAAIRSRPPEPIVTVPTPQPGLHLRAKRAQARLRRRVHATRAIVTHHEHTDWHAGRLQRAAEFLSRVPSEEGGDLRPAKIDPELIRALSARIERAVERWLAEDLQPVAFGEVAP